MNVSENVVYEDEQVQKNLVDRLKSLTVEPRDNTRLRIVLLASGWHFAGCVFDGDTVVAHKTFHRYVVRAKAGKKQSSKDASGRTVHSAGSSRTAYCLVANCFMMEKSHVLPIRNVLEIML